MLVSVLGDSISTYEGYIPKTTKYIMMRTGRK